MAETYRFLAVGLSSCPARVTGSLAPADQSSVQRRSSLAYRARLTEPATPARIRATHGDPADPAEVTFMTRLAGKLPSPDEVRTRIRKGPVGACDVYGDGDIDDWREVETLRRATCWTDAQLAVDDVLGIKDPIATNAFRYHFSKKCGHWTEAQKRVEL